MTTRHTRAGRRYAGRHPLRSETWGRGSSRRAHNPVVPPPGPTLRLLAGRWATALAVAAAAFAATKVTRPDDTALIAPLAVALVAAGWGLSTCTSDRRPHPLHAAAYALPAGVAVAVAAARLLF